MLFNPVVVIEQIDQPAGAGQSLLRIANEARVDLSDSKAFRRLHELGYGARPGAVASEPGEELSERYGELIIGWGVNCGVSVGAPLG